MMSEASLNETRSAPFDHDGTQEYDPSPTDRRLPPPPPPSTPISFDDECAEPPSTASDTCPESPVSFTSEARVVLSSHAKFAPSSSTRAEFRPKSVFYKTKPCKFYHSQGSCIKGDRCNFIHESGETSTTSKDVAGTRDSEPGSGFPGNHITFSSYQKQHALPDKPVSSLKEQRRSNFYPVAWRVIGGGVMMGGHREICHDYIVGHCPEGEDCKFAHPDVSAKRLSRRPDKERTRKPAMVCTHYGRPNWLRIRHGRVTASYDPSWNVMASMFLSEKEKLQIHDRSSSCAHAVDIFCT
ncbi:hypothetical protein WOLCODRAFT_136768 [Wolfiporia cocos MD-104 SS10]|uniref:C3H1-type domain-containing protein n=1 Tax=Wolfiporia cocos (strain MD-104) TaxID=742152 RepID=A0A2H3JDI9_WOLCO|nr:hypothetical protein WOLCODRAFT_136768 [Wolfiporia cocos MD-104 SS10]